MQNSNSKDAIQDQATIAANPMFYAVGCATSYRQIEKQLLGLYLFFEAAEQLPTKEAKL